MKISAKDIAGLLRTLSRTATEPHFTSAIIAAAGCGSRMGDIGGKTKQLTEINGLPVIVHTLLAFQRCECINEIVVVGRADELSVYEEYKSTFGLDKLTKVVEGGKTRQESVLCGFEAISDESEFVAIHDGARCLITPEMIESVVREAYRRGAATAAASVTDTVKKEDGSGYISETYDRSSLWGAQTPQVFKTEIYRAAAYIAKEENFETTDDNALAERLGFKVKLVDCGRENIKITTPLDLKIAELILSEREKKND